jgi:hypothetical protein
MSNLQSLEQLEILKQSMETFPINEQLEILKQSMETFPINKQLEILKQSMETFAIKQQIANLKQSLQKKKGFSQFRIIDKYIRMKLGQSYPIHEYKKDHLRIDFDAQDETEHNKKVIELFEDDFFNKKKVVLHSEKGGISVYIVSKENYDKYDYWKYKSFNEMVFPYEIKLIDRGGISTIEIIEKIITYFQEI